MRVGHDRFNLIVGTPEGIATRSRDLLPDAITVVVEGAIAWCKKNRADIWAYADQPVRRVAAFPASLVVWGLPGDERVWLAAGVQFHALPDGSIMGDQGIPRPADAFFRALELACETCHAKTVRVFGCEGWKGDDRWKRSALGKLWRDASAHGVEIQRPYLPSQRLR
jgi:hypothetical protein